MSAKYDDAVLGSSFGGPRAIIVLIIVASSSLQHHRDAGEVRAGGRKALVGFFVSVFESNLLQ
jgi:hypothetical protein